jgi:dipeptidyl aminopeptidase/acylaminoacyl peptidase
MLDQPRLLDLNYRGSSGYGGEYRRKLYVS